MRSLFTIRFTYISARVNLQVLLRFSSNLLVGGSQTSHFFAVSDVCDSRHTLESNVNYLAVIGFNRSHQIISTL